MSQAQGAPNAAGTVPVRVQVIDIEPFAIDLVVPTYLPASDLTQRVARDAGLGAYWDDGVRRTFWLRARGRVMLPHEKLEDLGVVPGELLHLLPQPPDGSMVLERPPEYPRTRGYSAAGHLNVAGGFLTVVGWTFGWAVALLFQPGVAVSVLPAAGLSLLSSSFVRHAVGGEGSNWKVPVFGFLVYWPLITSGGLLRLPLGSAMLRSVVSWSPASLSRAKVFFKPILTSFSWLTPKLTDQNRSLIALPAT